MSRAKSGSRRRSVSEINVVPYIDVMLVLLIIFMVTAPLLKQGVEVDLPIAPANPLDVNSPEPIIVSIDINGAAYLNISPQPDSELDVDSLVGQIKATLLEEPQRPVMVRGDANGPYQNVVSILVLLQKANVGSVGLITESEDGQ
ncbi:MAG: biopolymer transport protein TolR [Gammaproteobacteria bacterium]|jgi:biopolymer transport protein TolR